VGWIIVVVAGLVVAAGVTALLVRNRRRTLRMLAARLADPTSAPAGRSSERAALDAFSVDDIATEHLGQLAQSVIPDATSATPIANVFGALEHNLAVWAGVDGALHRGLSAAPDDGASLGHVMAAYAGGGSDEGDGELPSTAAAIRNAARSMRAVASEIVAESDAHAADVAALRHSMHSHALDTGAGQLPGSAEYEKLNAGYAEHLSAITTEGIAALRSALARTSEQGPAVVREKIPMPLAAPEASEMRALIVDLRDATREYARQVAEVLHREERLAERGDVPPVASGEVRAALDDIAPAIERCGSLLGRGSFVAALASLLETQLPPAPGWRPSDAYDAACTTAQARLRDLSNRRRERIAQEFVATSGELSAVIESLRVATVNAGTACARRRDQAWSTLEESANALKRNTVRRLREASAAGADDTLRTAGKSLEVWDNTAANLLATVKGVFPDPSRQARATDIDHLAAPLRDVLEGVERNAAAASTALGARPAERDLAAVIEHATTPIDVHADDVSALSRSMAALALDGDTTPVKRATYARRRASYRSDVEALAAELSYSGEASIAQARQRFVSEAARPPRLEEWARDDLRTAAEALGAEIAEYAERAYELVRDAQDTAGEQDQTTDALRRSLATAATARKELQRADGASITAVVELTATQLPAAPSWLPSDRYQAACRQAAIRLNELVARYRRECERWATAASTSLDRVLADLEASLVAAADTFTLRREAVWMHLERSAEALKRGTAELLTAPSKHAAGEPVRVATAALIVDDAAATNLALFMHDAIPEPPAAANAATADQVVEPFDAYFASLDRNAGLAAAVDGALLTALHPNGLDAAGLAHAMTQFAGVPVEVARAGGGLFGYLHSANFAANLDKTAHVMLKHASDGLLPSLHIVTNHGLEAGIESVAHSSEAIAASLPFKLAFAEPGARGLAFEKFLGKQGFDGFKELTQLSAKAPQMHQAGVHVVTAGHHLGAGLHGVMGHVPWVTLVLSSVREVRLGLDHKTTLDRAFTNVVLDVSGVGVGYAAAAAAGAIVGIHGGPLIVLAVPGAMIGRKFSDKIKRKKFQKATDAYDLVSAAYPGQVLVLANEFAGTARSEIHSARDQFVRTLVAPRPLEETSKKALGPLVRTLHEATAAYTDRATALLVESGTPSGNKARKQLARAADDHRRSGAALDEGRFLEALMMLTATPLPALPSWGPSDAYASVCTTTASRLRDMGDARREANARWAVDAGRRLDGTLETLGASLVDAVATHDRRADAVRAGLESAAAAMNREAAALGVAV
jgi:hypothetical protein